MDISSSLDKSTEIRHEIQKKLLQEEFIEDIDIGGFRHLVTRKGIRQIIWILVWLAALFSSFYLFRDAVNDYAEYSSYSRYKKVPVTEFDFPSITFCGYNSKLSDGYEELDDPFEYYNKTELNMHNMFTRRVNMIRAPERGPCRYYNMPCDGNDFKMSYSWQAPGSFCSEFNPYKGEHKGLKVKAAGIENSFSFAIDLRQEDVKGTFNLTGISVLFHPYAAPGVLPDFGNLMTAKPGYMTIFTITRLEKNYYLEPPYASKCGRKDYKLVNETLPYSKAMCVTDCAIHFAYQKCGCVGFEMQGYVDVPICTRQQDKCYAKEMFDHFKRRGSVCDCPQECFKYTFDIETSELLLGNRNAFPEIAKDFNLTEKEVADIFRHQLLAITVYYREMIAFEDRETPKVKLSNLLATVGGDIGLFVSFTIITLLQFIHFAWKYVALKTKHVLQPSVSYEQL